MGTEGPHAEPNGPQHEVHFATVPPRLEDQSVKDSDELDTGLANDRKACYARAQ